MKRFRFRFSVRWLMIAVAIVGIFLGILAERRARFLHIVAEHKKALASVPPQAFIAFILPKEIEYRWAMIEKYERAARYPWVPVEPDAPEPN